MADTLCPTCGKQNPDDLEICQYCQARLKPLFSDSESEPSGVRLPFIWDDSSGATYEPAGEGDLPDWLRSLRSDDMSTDAAAEEKEEELPDWFTSPPPEGALEPDALPAADTDQPDWLTGLRSIDGEQENVPEVEAAATGSLAPEGDIEENLPDWLKPFTSEGSEELPPSAALQATEIGDQEPEWLKRVRERIEEDSAVEQEEEQGTEPPSLDETVSSLGDLSLEMSSGDQSQAFSGELSAEMPGWLADLVETRDDAELAELPEWLDSGDIIDETGPQIEPAPVETTPVEEIGKRIEVQGYQEEGSELPDWLISLESRSTLSADEYLPQFPEPAEPEVASDIQALQEVPQVDLFQTSAAPETSKTVLPFTFSEEEPVQSEADNLPEWLTPTYTDAETTPEMEEHLETTAIEPLEPAALPGWLAAIRPVEAFSVDSAAQEEAEQRPETSGPLAGLKGILRAEPEFIKGRKSAAIALKLQVSDANQAQADLLKDLVDQEGRNRAIPGAPVLSRQFFMRTLVFIVLLLGIGWPLVMQSQDVALPEYAPQETIALREMVDYLPNSAPVLVAVDYEAGFSGEMDIAASALLDHLMIKGSYLTFVSTLPNGSLQAERLISLLNTKSGHGYATGINYVNLGYIPGGITGLLAFSQSPRELTPTTLTGVSAWSEEPLSNITSLSDFSMVVVATENADTARYWVEQVGPALQGGSLMLVASAQAEPLLRPYYDGAEPQVAGMIFGVPGAAAYESQMVRTGMARLVWDAFSYGISTALCLILIIGLANIYLHFEDEQKKLLVESRR